MWETPTVHTFLGDALLTFDGAVVEAFGARENANGRVHVAMIDRIEVATTRREAYLQVFTVWRTSPLLVTFPQEQQAQAQEFVAAVEAARRGGHG